MPPSTDYTTTGGGLKLKGAKFAGIDKKKKKKRVPATAPTQLDDSTAADNATPPAPAAEAETEVARVKKTDAEKRHDEMRRKRLDEKVKREGSKTHKERVEELNRYLSGLSEHHDMPRIGPG
ncbi:hypothetical protein ANO11243_058300 [Dothideomycetidae sp. 11243]|nr:hypothetical protein ANO11243_058300 [fungal sp. No.11243]